MRRRGSGHRSWARWRRAGWAAAVLVAGGAAAAVAADLAVETVATRLDAPWGVAVHPRSGIVFVAEAAAGRVRTIDPERPGPPSDAITGFDPVKPRETFPFGAALDLTFLNHRILLLAGARRGGVSAELAAYEIPDAGLPIKAGQSAEWIRRLAPAAPTDAPRTGRVSPEGDRGGTARKDAGKKDAGKKDAGKKDAGKKDAGKKDAGAKGPGGQGPASGDLGGDAGALLRVTAIDDRVLVTVARRGSAGRLHRIVWRQGKPGTVAWWRPGGPADAIGPAAITVNDRSYPVTTRLGEKAHRKGGSLVFHAPSDGHVVLDLPVDLPEIIDIAYRRHEQGYRLYALDLGWDAPRSGGLYRIDAGRGAGPPVRAVRLLPLDRPTAMAFAPDGRLFITTAGRPDAQGSGPSGTLVVVASGL